MKFVIALFALAALASVDAAPAETPTWSDNLFYTGTLDEAQGAIQDVGVAEKRLAAKEAQLETLVAGVTDLFIAEETLERAVNADEYANSFKSVTTAD